MTPCIDQHVNIFTAPCRHLECAWSSPLHHAESGSLRASLQQILYQSQDVRALVEDILERAENDAQVSISFPFLQFGLHFTQLCLLFFQSVRLLNFLT